ncbi:hypothetical protein D3C83_12730 [compost metagenome]
MEIAVLARVVVVEIARRASRPARIDAHADVAVRHPLLGIHHLPALVLVGAAGHRIRVVARHDFPRGLVAFLECEALAIGAIARERRIAPFGDRPEHVRPQHQTIIHGDRHVPVDAHAVADLTFVIAHTSSFLSVPRVDRQSVVGSNARS